MTRLENVYREKVVPVLQKEFAYSSPSRFPGLSKFAEHRPRFCQPEQQAMEEAMNELSVNAGQRP